ncbi:tyrosine-type recombinase/integrase [Kocuria palustris]|uniref:tyrosine-type recombinase/integrase n=1 Tax=Kocuria palustris TaxID=71999 RepID=UPI0011A7ECD4
MSDTALEWATAIDDFTSWLRAGGQSAGTLRLRRWGLNKLAEQTSPRSPWAVTPEELQEWISNPAWSPNTRKSARATIRRFYQWAHATQRRPDDPAALLLTIRIPPARPRPTPTMVLYAALERAENDRERLMLLLASFGGLRRSEIAAVHADDLQADLLFVVGKGGRQRFLPIHPVLAPFLDRLRARGGWAFPGRFGGHCHPDYIGKRLSRLLGPGWTGHTLRHHFATAAYNSTRDLRAVQELLGHASVATTQIYVGVDAAALNEAVRLIPLPETRHHSCALQTHTCQRWDGEGADVLAHSLQGGSCADHHHAHAHADPQRG